MTIIPYAIIFKNCIEAIHRFRWMHPILFLLFFITFNIPAQDLTKAKVQAKACVKTDKIIIRWAPTTPIAWQWANEYGYTVEKYRMVKNGKALDKPERMPLDVSNFKPKSLAEWETEAVKNKNKYAAIGAQSIYGKTFQLDNKSGDIYQFINKAKELENRFSFALFSADQSTEVAQLMGLRLEDLQINPMDKYIYRIFANVPLSKEKIDTGFVLVDAKTITPFPIPKEISAIFGNRTVAIGWDNRFYADIYSGYNIERSEDGIQWQVRNKELYVPVSEDGKILEKPFYSDSLPQNGKIYQYRIRGKNFFGEYSEASPIVKGAGKEPLTIMPKITSVAEVANGMIRIDWELPDSLSGLVKQFRLYNSSKVKGTFKKVKTMGAKERNTVFEKPLSVNYLAIAALGTDSVEYRAMPVMFQLKDLMPPSAPQQVTGSIDTNGIVTIRWKANKENDLLGYRVFRANSKAEEFAGITTSINSDTVFKEKITLKTLTHKIYYKVRALDFRHNTSDFSMLLELKKPDKIAPSSPVITECVATENGIKIAWAMSTEDDVDKHVLYRSEEGKETWTILKTTSKASSRTKLTMDTYVDDDPNLSKSLFYVYKIVATDESGNASEAALIKTKKIDTGKRAEIKDFKVSADKESMVINLEWKYKEAGVNKIHIYRKTGAETLKLYKSVEATTTKYIDSFIKQNTTYGYLIRAEYTDGGSSPLTKEAIVAF